jgi:hypothetical protein
MNVIGEITWHLGDDCARLKFSESRTSFSIDIVTVPAAFRNKGIGKSLIGHVLFLADALNKNTLVTVRPIGQTSEAAPEVDRLLPEAGL